MQRLRMNWDIQNRIGYIHLMMRRFLRKFKENVLLMDKTELGDTPGLDFNKFDFSVYEWSEIYADMYKREYCGDRLAKERGLYGRTMANIQDGAGFEKAAEDISEEFQMQ